MDQRRIGIVLFIVLGCIGVSQANIGTCSQKLFQCTAYKNDLMKDGKLFDTEVDFQTICSKNYFFSQCVESKLQTCATGSKIPVLAQFFYETRLIAREVCLKTSKFNKLYLDASSCINVQARNSREVCERSSLNVTDERHQNYKEQFCRDIGRAFECQEKYLNKVCGKNAGNLYKRLQVYQKDWDFECYRFLSKHKTIQKDSSMMNYLLSTIGKVISGSTPTIGNFENSKRELFQNYSDVKQTIPFIVFDPIAVQELLDIKRDTMTKKGDILRNLTHSPSNVVCSKNHQTVTFNRTSHSEEIMKEVRSLFKEGTPENVTKAQYPALKKGTDQYKEFKSHRTHIKRNFGLYFMENKKTDYEYMGCGVGHFEWVKPKASLKNINCSWNNLDGSKFRCKVELDPKCPNTSIIADLLFTELILFKSEKNLDIKEEIATIKNIKFSKDFFKPKPTKRIGIYADPIEDVDNTAVITDSAKIDNKHGRELFSMFGEEKLNKYSPFELYVNALADLASSEVNFGKDNTLGYVYDPELRGIFGDSRRDYLEGVYDETMDIMIQSQKGDDLFEKRSLGADAEQSISNEVENIGKEEGVDEVIFHPLSYESMEAYNAPTHPDMDNESKK